MESVQVVEAGNASRCEVAEEIIRFPASGFRYVERPATLYPTMWRDMCAHNRDAKLEALRRFSKVLASLERATAKNAMICSPAAARCAARSSRPARRWTSPISATR